MKKIMPMFMDLMEDVMATEKDVRRFDNKNIAAGMRVRKQMQAIRKHALNIRREIQIRRRAIRQERKNAKKAETN